MKFEVLEIEHETMEMSIKLKPGEDCKIRVSGDLGRMCMTWRGKILGKEERGRQGKTGIKPEI